MPMQLMSAQPFPMVKPFFFLHILGCYSCAIELEVITVTAVDQFLFERQVRYTVGSQERHERSFLYSWMEEDYEEAEMSGRLQAARVDKMTGCSFPSEGKRRESCLLSRVYHDVHRIKPDPFIHEVKPFFLLTGQGSKRNQHSVTRRGAVNTEGPLIVCGEKRCDVEHSFTNSFDEKLGFSRVHVTANTQRNISSQHDTVSRNSGFGIWLSTLQRQNALVRKILRQRILFNELVTLLVP